MRKVTFKIDDLAFFKKHYNLTDEQMQDIFSDKESFKVIYTLIGEGKSINKYELMDYAGNKISINDLNGYEKGIVLNDCYAYFTGGKYHSNAEVPCGVVDIKEEETYRIGKYDKHSDGKYYFVEEKTTDSPYWKVINGTIYYVFGTGKYGVDYKEELHKMPMNEAEAMENNCCCYYRILK